jgi:hypothetical protein
LLFSCFFLLSLIRSQNKKNPTITSFEPQTIN